MAGSIERANQRALLAEIESQIELAEARLARYAQLEGAIPGKDVEAVRIELMALRQRRAAVSDGLKAAEVLRAPVSGVISAAHGVTGQVVDAGELLYEIVDPSRLAVEALAYDAATVTGIAAASLVLPGGSLPLEFIGAGRQLREQALPLLFRLRPGSTAQPPSLVVSQPVKVVARTTAGLQGAALPKAALTRDDSGRSVVWVKLGAERYIPRQVEYQLLDGEQVVVTAGLDDGERVVIAGASLLGQLR
ncbi:MAG: efflux RND transporter periplasmic adaptor subunit [Thiobacillaceae bacterium]